MPMAILFCALERIPGIREEIRSGLLGHLSEKSLYSLCVQNAVVVCNSLLMNVFVETAITEWICMFRCDLTR